MTGRFILNLTSIQMTASLLFHSQCCSWLCSAPWDRRQREQTKRQPQKQGAIPEPIQFTEATANSPPPPRSPGASNLTLKNLEKVIYGQSTKKLARTWKLKAGHAVKITKQIEKEEGRPRKITSARAAARNGYCIKPSDKKQSWFSSHYPCWQFFNLTLCVKIQANGFSALPSSQQTGHGLDSRDLFLISHNNSE